MQRFLLVLMLVACAPAPPNGPVITGACKRAFAPTLEAWETALGRVPDTCSSLDTQIGVQLVAKQSDLPCPPPAVNETLIGCTQGSTIYLLRERDNVDLVDTSVHEWVHALAQCVYGDPDADHLRAQLWGYYGADTIETQAQAAAQIGECL